MNMDESVEAVLSERIRECVARKRLPDGFGARLSASVRRAQRRHGGRVVRDEFRAVGDSPRMFQTNTKLKKKGRRTMSVKLIVIICVAVVAVFGVVFLGKAMDGKDGKGDGK